MFGMQVQSQVEEGGYENVLYLKGGGGHEKNILKE
jgi:hypothetical protein